MEMYFNLGRSEHVCRLRGGFREEETAEGVREKEGARGENRSRKQWVQELQRKDVSQRGGRVGLPLRGKGKIGRGQR